MRMKYRYEGDDAGNYEIFEDDRKFLEVFGSEDEAIEITDLLNSTVENTPFKTYSQKLNWMSDPTTLSKIDRVLNRVSVQIPGECNLEILKMDLIICNNHAYELDFESLVNYRDMDFYHDISGISHYLDRRTGKLNNCFLPRCAK